MMTFEEQREEHKGRKRNRKERKKTYDLKSVK